MICPKCRKDYSVYEQWCPRCGEPNYHLVDDPPEVVIKKNLTTESESSISEKPNN